MISGEKGAVPDEFQAAYVSDPENRRLVIVAATIAAIGRSVLPILIFKMAYHLRKYFDNDIDTVILWPLSKSSFTSRKKAV